MKLLKSRIILIVTFGLASLLAHAQGDITLDFKTPIVRAYVDRPGDFYIIESDSTFHKFSTDGELLAQAKFRIPTLFDPWYDIESLLYYSGDASYYTVSGSMEDKRNHPIDPAFVIEPKLVCLSGEKNIWILDQADWSVKRINTFETKVEAEERIPENQLGEKKFTFMREYQNFLFLQEGNTSILVFNHLGLFIKKLSTAAINSFNFLGEELYYSHEGKLTYLDLFDGKSRTKPVDPDAKDILLTGNKMILVFDKKVIIKPLNP